ncbi:right-handed parallel beta-helix repeat-containing protein [Thiohalorhabdus methylotrophus]|uniref:Right-handed parallel beta-helix repeat-containing protein n=1 Tax=Thiohalorhabdus methylotrophus TaxID=3242694 RepID=A0ABV4TXH8_9GAMM
MAMVLATLLITACGDSPNAASQAASLAEQTGSSDEALIGGWKAGEFDVSGSPECPGDTCAGSSFQYDSIQEAVDNAPDGGVVGIQSGSYKQCVVIRDPKSVTIKALDGRPHLHTKQCEQKANVVNYSTGKVVLEGLEVSDGGTDKLVWHHDKAGALILRDMKLHGAGMGILASTESERLEVIDSEIWDMDEPTQNGHLIYAGQVKDLIVRGSYLHGARNGHLIKAKSVNVVIENNHLHDDKRTTANLINLWGCGNNRVVGNAIVSENQSGAVQAMDVTARKRYGNVQPCPVDEAKLTVAYNSFLKKGQTLYSSLLLDVYDMDEMVIENNLVTNARLMKDGTTTGVYWYPGDWNGKNMALEEEAYIDRFLHVDSAPSAVPSENEPVGQYAHPSSTTVREEAFTMGAYPISQ